MKIYMVNAFTYENQGGNPAGVCLNGQGLSEERMLAIAKEIGASETAFVLDSDRADFRIRYFTPVEEVPLCGHATIATVSQLLSHGLIEAGSHIMETGAGVLPVEVSEGGQVWMNQAQPVFDRVKDPGVILESLGLVKEDLDPQLDIEVVTTGLRDIFIPVKSEAILNNLHPNFDQIKTISIDNEVSGYHVFALGQEGDFTASCRNFAPYYDIDEESATGTSSGALAALLHKRRGRRGASSFKQGEAMGATSVIFAQIEEMDDQVVVRVGGVAAEMGVRQV